MQSDILESLNASQRAAVEYNDGPSLVIAGAGSGKTRVLTYKVAYLLSQGVKPWNILALTFTNKAANEMRQRINAIAGDTQAQYIRMGTFHSIFSRILRIEAEHIGYEPNFTIYDDSDSKSLVKAIIKEMGLNDKVYKPSSMASRISMAKNNLILAEEYANNRSLMTRDFETHTPDFSKIYKQYSERCKMANAMDFDDLLTNTYLLFENNSEVLSKYVDTFKYILVDEYQDTNAVQQKIVRQLAGADNKVCAVGDDAQSIYAFRGANIDNMLSFEQTFMGTKLFKLEQNYRSTKRIVEAANSLIHHNRRQIRKEVFSENDEGKKLTLKLAYSDKEEAAIVCKEIKSMQRREDAEYSDFAILYRTNAQSRSFEEALRKGNIPYKIYGGLSFYQRKEIKDIIAYFRLIVNPNDEEALKRIINYPTRGIGNTTLQKIITSANENNVSLWNIITMPQHYGLNVSKATVNKLSVFKSFIGSFIVRLSEDDAYSIGYDIVKESGIAADLYADRDTESIAKQENLEEFLNSIQDFVEVRKEDSDLSQRIYLTDFLQEISLLTDIESSEEDNSAKVNLMTIHSAKGLEFPNVFIVGLEENIFPSPMSCTTEREIEEERRLLYVAITRAEKNCFLSCARNRYRFGKMEFDTPSRFIKDIDPNLLEVHNLIDSHDSTQYSSSPYSYKRNSGSNFGNMFRQSDKPEYAQPSTLRRISSSPSTASSNDMTSLQSTGRQATLQPASSPAATSANGLQAGMDVEHSRFGIGKILKIEGSGENCKATVEFQNLGTKQLLVKFAKLRILN